MKSLLLMLVIVLLSFTTGAYADTPTDARIANYYYNRGTGDFSADFQAFSIGVTCHVVVGGSSNLKVYDCYVPGRKGVWQKVNFKQLNASQQRAMNDIYFDAFLWCTQNYVQSGAGVYGANHCNFLNNPSLPPTSLSNNGVPMYPSFSYFGFLAANANNPWICNNYEFLSTCQW